MTQVQDTLRCVVHYHAADQIPVLKVLLVWFHPLYLKSHLENSQQKLLVSNSVSFKRFLGHIERHNEWFVNFLVTIAPSINTN